MCLISSVYFCAAESCWAKFSTASSKRPVWDMGAFKNRALSASPMSARHSHRWRSWTTQWTSHGPERPRHNLRRSNFWVMTTLVQVPQCLGQVNLQQRHSVWGGSSFSAGRSVRADECLQAQEGSNGLPRKVEAVFGHNCIATDRSTGRTSIYPHATPSSRVAREDEPLERFLDVKGAIYVPVSSSCTFREERHWGGALRTSVGHPMKPIV